MVVELHRAGQRLQPDEQCGEGRVASAEVLVHCVPHGLAAHAGSVARGRRAEIIACALRPSGPSTRMSQGTRTRGSIVTLSSLAPMLPTCAATPSQRRCRPPLSPRPRTRVVRDLTMSAGRAISFGIALVRRRSTVSRDEMLASSDSENVRIYTMRPLQPDSTRNDILLMVAR